MSTLRRRTLGCFSSELNLPALAGSGSVYEAYFHTDEFINHVLAKSVEGIRDGRQISYEAFKWLELPYCGISEQKRIAGLFEILNRRIQKQRALVEALK